MTIPGMDVPGSPFERQAYRKAVQKEDITRDEATWTECERLHHRAAEPSEADADGAVAENTRDAAVMSNGNANPTRGGAPPRPRMDGACAEHTGADVCSVHACPGCSSPGRHVRFRRADRGVRRRSDIPRK